MWLLSGNFLVFDATQTAGVMSYVRSRWEGGAQVTRLSCRYEKIYVRNSPSHNNDRNVYSLR